MGRVLPVVASAIQSSPAFPNIFAGSSETRYLRYATACPFGDHATSAEKLVILFRSSIVKALDKAEAICPQTTGANITVQARTSRLQDCFTQVLLN
jgi:hypothetical protein